MRAGATELKPRIWLTPHSAYEPRCWHHCHHLLRLSIHAGVIAGGGGFELGCTSANGGMEENFQQQQMMMAMPHLPGLASGCGFELGGTSADRGMYEMIKRQMMMMVMPPLPRLAGGDRLSSMAPI